MEAIYCWMAILLLKKNKTLLPDGLDLGKVNMSTAVVSNVSSNSLKV